MSNHNVRRLIAAQGEHQAGAELDRYLNFNQVQRLTGIKGRTTFWRMEKRGDFPKRIHLGPGQTMVRWIEREVLEWQRQVSERRFS